MKPERKKIGLALGGGAARGWAHIGVIRQLEAMGIPIDVVCGTSIGALVGGAYASGHLDQLETWLRSLQLHDIPTFFDVRFRGGIIQGKTLFDFFEKHAPDVPIEGLPIPFGAVSMDLDSGHEVWLQKGSLFQAVRASISLPGLFNPTFCNDRWLVDGGMVNPVPVSLCRAMGAETVIAVELTPFAQFGTKGLVEEIPENPPVPVSEEESWWNKARSLARALWGGELVKKFFDPAPNKHPGVIEVVSQSLLIMQSRITRSRFAVEPPDILLTPRVEKTGFMEFHRAGELIEIGQKSVREMIHTHPIFKNSAP